VRQVRSTTPENLPFLLRAGVEAQGIVSPDEHRENRP